MNNKEIATNFLTLAASGKVREAYAKYISPTFIHHNQYFKGDRMSLMLAMEEAHKKSPNKFLEIKQVVAEGDRVITYSHVRQKEGDIDIAVTHLFRFEKNMIAEMWDVGQLVAKDSPNQNGMF